MVPDRSRAGTLRSIVGYSLMIGVAVALFLAILSAGLKLTALEGVRVLDLGDRIEALIGVFGILGTLLLVLVGLLNFSVFRKQLRIAKEQIDTAVRQLEIAQKQPDLYLIQRAVTETSNHLRLFVERPKLRPYFYSEAEWKPGDEVSSERWQSSSSITLPRH